MKDPYTVLGVARDADQETIRKAYKKLARRYHPDVNKDPGAEERFKEINAAYDVVGDEEKRRMYDTFGEASTRPGFNPEAARAWGAGAPFDFGGGFTGGIDMEDLLGSLFGAGTSGRRARRGPDQQVRVPVDFMTAILGGERVVTVPRPGGGSETLTVPIPAGARSGGRVRLKGKGAPPRGGGPCGDLVVELDVAPHPVLRRRGDDLEMDVPITIREALEGARITVPTPTGPVKVTVPRGAASGTRLRLKGKGVQRKGRPGDLYLVLRPALPDRVDDATLEAARALDAAYTSDPRASLKL